MPAAAESSQFCCPAEICLAVIPLWLSVTSTSLGYCREKYPSVSHQKCCLALSTAR